MKKQTGGRSTKRRGSHPRKAPKGQARKKSASPVAWVWIGVAVVVVAGLVVWRMNASRRARSPSSGGAAREAPTDPAASQAPEVKTLVGRWVRTDTPYVIDIQSAQDDGTLDAAYYNPRPVNVSVAQAHDKDGSLTVFVELRDVNYPGSNYTLRYDQEKDILHGVYFQAAMRQSFEVVFRRLSQQR